MSATVVAVYLYTLTRFGRTMIVKLFLRVSNFANKWRIVKIQIADH